MRQPQFWLLALLSILALMTTASMAFAEGNALGGHVEVGATGINTKDNAARVNEYVRGRSEDGISFAPKLSLEGEMGEHSAFELEADANGPRDQKFNLELDAARIFRLGFDYQVMEHWKDHETLDQMGATGRDDIGGSQPSVTTDKIFANLPAGASVGGGTLNYDPLQAYTEELSNDYLVTRRELKSEAELVIPTLPNVVFHTGMRIEKRQGLEQAIGVTKCDNCHVSAVGKKIDEVTEDYVFGATGKFGLLTVDYEYLTRTFSESGSTPSRYYEDATNPTAYNMLYENGDFAFGRTPDSEKDSHALKARIDLPKDASLTASYVKSDIESSKSQTQGEYLLLDGSTLKSEYESFGTKLAGKIGKNLRLSLRGGIYDIDVNGNEIYYPARDAANAAAAWPETNTDAWHSAEARKVKEVGTDLVYRLARGTTLRLGYEFEEVDRDEEELLETDTHTLKASVKTRLNKALSGNLSYQFQKIDDPLPGAHVGIAQGDPLAIQDPLGSGLWYYNTAAMNTPGDQLPAANPDNTWYWTDVYPNRQLESTNLPDEVHEAKLSTTWAISANKAATLFARVRQAENDEVEFEQTTYVPGVSLWYAPNGKMNLTMAYTFNKQETENQMCVGWYHGWANDVSSGQFGSICNTAEYNTDVHTLALNLDYQATEKLKMNAGFTYNRAKSSWDWDFTERAQLTPENNLTTPLAETGIEAPGPYASVNYDTWEMNNLVDEYSDLAYQQYQFTLGGTYEFTDAFYTSASATYDIFRSKEAYVYGDEDGKAYYAYLGFGYRF